MALERPQVAMLAEAVQTRYDGAAKADPMKGALASQVTRLLHSVAMADYDAAGDVLADDVDFGFLASHVRFPVRHAIGRDAVIQALRANFPVVADQTMELIAFVEDATQCVMVSQERGRVVATGEIYEGYGTFIFTFAGDRIVRIRNIGAARDAD